MFLTEIWLLILILILILTETSLLTWLFVQPNLNARRSVIRWLFSWTTHQLNWWRNSWNDPNLTLNLDLDLDSHWTDEGIPETIRTWTQDFLYTGVLSYIYLTWYSLDLDLDLDLNLDLDLDPMHRAPFSLPRTSQELVPNTPWHAYISLCIDYFLIWKVPNTPWHAWY